MIVLKISQTHSAAELVLPPERDYRYDAESAFWWPLATYL